MLQMTLEWILLKLFFCCILLPWILWKKYLGKRNAIAILVIIFLSGLPSYFFFTKGAYEIIAALIFIAFRKRKKMPLFTKETFWLFLFIASAEAITFTSITFWNIATCGEY